MEDSKAELRRTLASYEENLERLRAEEAGLVRREHENYEDASRAIHLRSEISALSSEIFHIKEHIARDPG